MTTTDLSTLNAASAVVKKALQDAVCSYEQQSLDAARRGEYLSAQTYKQWAFATDLAIHTASMAMSALFLEALETPTEPHLRLVSRTDFPATDRSEADRHLDGLQVEVASAQPEPEPEPA
jgi:hypothetical protein